jgi:adenylate cyclase
MAALHGSGADPTVHGIRHMAHVDLAFCDDNAALAQEHAAAMSRLVEQHSVTYLKPFGLHCRGTAFLLSGDFDGAVDALEQALALVRQGNVATETETDILVSLAEAQRRAGRIERARALAQEALEISEQRTMRIVRCRALITMAATLVDEGTDLDGAARVLADAAALLEETGARIYAKHFDATLARLHRASGRVSEPAK